MVLNSLQEQSHVASLLGYSSPGELGATLPQPASPERPVAPATSSTEPQDHLHLAEVLLKTLLLSIGFYTVSEEPTHSGSFNEFILTCLNVAVACRSVPSANWRKTATSSSPVQLRNRPKLRLTSTTCCQHCINICWLTATSPPTPRCSSLLSSWHLGFAECWI